MQSNVNGSNTIDFATKNPIPKKNLSARSTKNCEQSYDKMSLIDTEPYWADTMSVETFLQQPSNTRDDLIWMAKKEWVLCVQALNAMEQENWNEFQTCISKMRSSK